MGGWLPRRHTPGLIEQVPHPLLLVRPGTVRGAGTAKVRRALLRERSLRGEVRARQAEFGPVVGEPCRGGAA
ncbi:MULTISPECIES: hypothetical protein [Streptomyces]|uniref:Uncharacterized protein n=1 Tax=Streptomyces mordarskii TaxID=1226758 RepID=A0ABP3PWG7_9ACTN|nr:MULTISPECIES: hypothetical protein [unclassified Streptomyces]AJZ87377.1 hypothetical protein AS97_33765 [Streptomyces sp. AgN23]RSS38708.1 hypothetical protein EF902_29480 [Streptomyces sp. WAC05858]WTB07712.1 hypothetical protein OG546_27900 [Streptomyces antimycoticus]